MLLNLHRLSDRKTVGPSVPRLCPDLGGLPARGPSALLLLVLLRPLGDVGVADQAAEQRRDLRPDVQLFLEEEKKGEVVLMSLVHVEHLI